jgi:hypothetical protein
MIYKCGHCGFKGECYGIPTSEGMSAPYCFRCKKNDKLTLLEPGEDDEIFTSRMDWRKKVEKVGGYKQAAVTIASRYLQQIVEEIEKLRKDNFMLVLEAKAMDHEDAAYVRKWIETFREDPAVPGILRMCNEAMEWRRDGERAKEFVMKTLNSYDAESLLGAFGDVIAKNMGLDTEAGMEALATQREWVKTAVELLEHFDDGCDCPVDRAEDGWEECIRCKIRKFFVDLPKTLKPKKYR